MHSLYGGTLYSVLKFHLAVYYKQFEKFEMAYNLHTVTTTILIPLPEPEQGNNLILSEPALDQLVGVSYRIFDICKHFQRLCIHHCVLPPVPIVSHPPQYFSAYSRNC